MVRFKVRYILFRIHFEEDPDLKINESILYNAIKNSIDTNFGNVGIGNISIKYYNPKTYLGIIRIDRNYSRHLMASITFINNIKKSSVMMQCLHLSGTIKQIQKRIINISSNEIKNIQLDKF